jgi:hypothetical protein
MTNLTKLTLFTIVLCFILTKSYCQYNPETNSFSSTDSPVITNTGLQNTYQNFSQIGGIPCTANSFWATSAGVDQYSLVGNTVTFLSTVCTPVYFNLAYCNNLNGGSFSSTFYDAIDSNVYYYDGSGWPTDPLNGPGRLFNCGGNGNFLYYSVAGATSYPKSIARYDGVSFTTIYTLPDTNQFLSVADLNIDDAGNVWFFTGFPVSPFSSDSLNVVSPSGQLIKQYPFSLNTANAYGSFMLNGIIYIGLGSGNSIHPNTLIPVTITSTTATAGAPIPMPAGINYADLASCNAGMPLSVREFTATESFSVYPNPATDFLTITSNTQNKNEYRIVDVKGCLVHIISFGGASIKADIHSLEPGVYFIECNNLKGTFRRKFIKL